MIKKFFIFNTSPPFFPKHEPMVGNQINIVEPTMHNQEVVMDMKTGKSMPFKKWEAQKSLIEDAIIEE